MQELSVNSGECVATAQTNVCLQAVVGACVSVCIRDRYNGQGGMCHYRLASANQSSSIDTQTFDYGDSAIVALLQKLKRLGAKRQHLDAWVIGGGNLNTSSIPLCRQIGVRNIAIAFRVLAEYGIRIIGTSVGGDTGRQIRFFPGKGEVLCRATHPAAANNCVQRKRASLVSGSAELYRKLQANLTQCLPSVTLELESPPQFQDADTKVWIVDESWLLSGITPKENIDKDSPCILLLNHDACPPPHTLERVMQTFGNLVFIATQDSLPMVLKAALHTGPLSCALSADEQALSHSLCKESLVMVGSSTGGIDALDNIIRHLPSVTPPICIVQHLPEDYTDSLAIALDKLSNLSVCRARDGMTAEPSTIYLAPGNRHLTVSRHGHQIILRLRNQPPVNGFCPSVDTLLYSALQLQGKRLIAVLLTGMGHDGAKGLLSLKQAGAITLIQDEQSSVVYGMARAADELGAATRVVPLENMGQAIVESVVKAQPIHCHSGTLSS